MTRLHPVSRAAITRGGAISTIRNAFIIPTILFLIVFNIFPLIYSLGYSFTDYPQRQRTLQPTSSGLQNYQRTLLSDRSIWNEFLASAPNT